MNITCAVSPLVRASYSKVHENTIKKFGSWC